MKFPTITRDILKGDEDPSKGMRALDKMIRDVKVGTYKCMTPHTTLKTGKRFFDTEKNVKPEKCAIAIKVLIPKLEKVKKTIKKGDKEMMEERLTEVKELVKDAETECMGTQPSTESSNEYTMETTRTVKAQRLTRFLNDLKLLHKKVTKLTDKCQ